MIKGDRFPWRKFYDGFHEAKTQHLGLKKLLAQFNQAGRLDVDLFNTGNAAGNCFHFPDQIGVLHDLGAGAKSNDAVVHEYLDLGS